MIAVLIGLLTADCCSAAAPQPPSNVVANDRPNDPGQAIDLEWELSPGDTGNRESTAVLRYRIQRMPGLPKSEENQDAAKIPPPPEFEDVGDVAYSKTSFTDTRCERGTTYAYRILAVGPDGTVSEPSVEATATAVRQWFNREKGWYAVLLGIVCVAIVGNIFWARRGRALWLRPIPALSAIDEAIGRATEMGRPCLFIPGIVDLDVMPTVAGLAVLGRVAQTVAEYDAELIVPTARSLVMTAARETVQAASLAAGRPESYQPESVFYLTDEQFGFASAVAGEMARNRPAACFYFGQFYAESLFLAETGQSVGAIQIAGTSEPSQLPFFVAACDYTLIGEEFFAASAYLSREPQQLGSIVGQDLGKLLGVGLLALGVALVTVQQLLPDSTWIRSANAFIQSVLS